MTTNLASFTDVLGDADEIDNSQPISLSSPLNVNEPAFHAHNVDTTTQSPRCIVENIETTKRRLRPQKHTGQHGDFRSVEEIDTKYRSVFSYPYFNLVQSGVIEDALYSDKSMVVCAPTGSGKTVIFEMAIVQLMMALEDRNYTGDFKIIYMAPVKALCTERLTEWYPKFTRLGLLCIEVTGDTDVDFSQLKPYRIIITTPEKWDMMTRRWRDHNRLVGTIKLFLIDEVHILNDQSRGPVLEAVVSRMKTIEASSQSAHRIEQLQKRYNQEYSEQESQMPECPRIRFVAVSATVSNPEDVAAWLGADGYPAVFYKFGDECRPVRLKRVVEGYPCPPGCSPFKFDIILNYKLWAIIHKYHDGKPTLIFCNTRKSVTLTAETLSKEITVSFSPEQKARLAALASSIKNKKLQSLVLSGVGCHHAGLLFEERLHIEAAFRSRDLPILITTTTLAMGVNLPAHLVIIKNTQQYVNGQYQEYSISTVLQMVGRAGRPQFDSEATAVIMTTARDKGRYQALVEGDEPLQSYLHKRLAENLNSEAALGTVTDVAQCVQWLRSTFLYVRAAKDPKRYLGLQQAAPAHLITKKLEELCVCAMNGLASAGLIVMDEASCIESTEAGRLMSIYYIDLETMKHIMKIKGTETLEQLLWILCESHELADMHLRMDERRCLNQLNRNSAATTIRYQMKGKINSRQMKLNCLIQAVLGCLPIPEPALHQEAAKVMRVADRLCKCLLAYVCRAEIIATRPQYYSAVFNSLILAKCIAAQLWENSPYVSKQLKGIGPSFSALLATAGKVNFLLLEESHPRDLERIMNKGPPAGNVLRKQVSLLPKYQLTATPRDQSTIGIKLQLLNQAYLSENMDNLTSGDSHKCHIVVGDSENHLLLLTSFKDKDLMSMYDGTIEYEITRIHNFEHKIFVHCISSKFVGLDAQCEYTFKDLSPMFSRDETCAYASPDLNKKTSQKQTCITDTFKQRKRKNNEVDITQSKERKKRDTALMDKFKSLTESFGAATKEIKENLHKTSAMTDKILNDTFVPKTPSKLSVSHDSTFHSETDNKMAVNESMTEAYLTEASNVMSQKDHNKLATQNYTNIDFNYPEIFLDAHEDESFIVDDNVEDILSEIEKEMSTSKDIMNSSKCPMTGTDFSTEYNSNKDMISHDYKFAAPKETVAENRSTQLREEILNLELKTGSSLKSKLITAQESKKSLVATRKRKAMNPRSNFSFIDTLEKRMDSVENEEIVPVKESGFSDAIKKEIEKFLNSSKKNTKQTDTAVKELIGADGNAETTEDDIVDLTMENIPVHSEVNSIQNKSEKSRVYDLSELPEVYIEDTNKIKRKSIIETTQWLGTKNLESVETIDLDSDVYHTSYPDSEQATKVTIDPPKVYWYSDEKNNLNSSQKGSVSHAYSTQPSADICPTNYSNEAQLQVENTRSQPPENYSSHDLGIHSIIAIYDRNRNRNSALLLKDSDANGNTNIKQLSHHFSKSVTEVNPWKIDSDNNENTSTVDLNKFVPVNNATSARQNFYQNPKNDDNTTKSLELPQLVHKNNRAADRAALNHSTEANLNPISNRVPRYSKSNKLENSLKDQYVNKYSFSAMKINVCTKNTPEEKVQIIRKLKVDLDVTEIISRERTKLQKTDNTTHEKRQATCSQQERNNSGEHLSLNQRQSSYLHSAMLPQSSPALIHQYNIEGWSQNTTKRNTESSIVAKLNERNEMLNSQSSTLPMLKEYEKNTEIIEMSTAEGTKLPHPNESNAANDKKLQDVSNDQKTVNENQVSEQSKEGLSSSGHIHIKVQSILDRYMNAFRQNTEDINRVITKTKNEPVNESPQKFKRPFKISDIHKIDFALPKTLEFEVSRSQTPKNEDALCKAVIERRGKPNVNLPYGCEKTFTRPMKYNKIMHEDENDSQDHNMPQGLKYDNDTIRNERSEIHDYTPPNQNKCFEEIQDEIVETVGDSPPVDEMSIDYNIDQDMLDPQSLLRRFTEDDEIIPPPQEFGDNNMNIYSPTHSFNQKELITDGLHNPYNIQSDHDESYGESDDDEPQRNIDTTTNQLLDRTNNKSIFEESTRNILTPSKEIETWTFSMDELDESRPRKFIPPLKCVTVMRNNPGMKEFGKPDTSRHSKLNKFRAPMKDKLKL